MVHSTLSLKQNFVNQWLLAALMTATPWVGTTCFATPELSSRATHFSYKQNTVTPPSVAKLPLEKLKRLCTDHPRLCDFHPSKPSEPKPRPTPSPKAEPGPKSQPKLPTFGSKPASIPIYPPVNPHSQNPVAQEERKTDALAFSESPRNFAKTIAKNHSNQFMVSEQQLRNRIEGALLGIAENGIRVLQSASKGKTLHDFLADERPDQINSKLAALSILKYWYSQDGSLNIQVGHKGLTLAGKVVSTTTTTYTIVNLSSTGVDDCTKVLMHSLYGIFPQFLDNKSKSRIKCDS